MKAILIFFDTLNKRFLDYDWVHAPNFKRLAEKTVVFDNHYVGSLPCMPARRELHTGRYNFLHRSWGSLEPFDDSMPEILKRNGVYSHLISDHYHYWEDGGGTYHNRYSSWEIVRGEEGDAWKGEVKDPEIPDHVPNMRTGTEHWRQDWVNRKYMSKEEDMPLAKTFNLGLDFLEKNHKEDFFLTVETFDPHEPFYAPQKYRDLYEDDYNGPHFDWPNYSVVNESPEAVEHCRKEYAASLSMCDNYLGKILDFMDNNDMWKDTLLIVSTDHGFLLGEKDWWGKMVQPIYNEIAQIPLFIWDPRSRKRNEKRRGLVQTTDISPTILEFFNIKRPKDMQGYVLKDIINSDIKVRDSALFGVHGSHVNITDGRYVYMRGPINPMNKPLYNYTLIPTVMRGFIGLNQIKTISLAEPFKFTKGCKTMRFNARSWINPYIYGSYLFDLQTDPTQDYSIFDTEIEKKMIISMIKEMKKNDAPFEQYERLGIPFNGEVTKEHCILGEIRADIKDKIGETEIIWKNKGKSMFYFYLSNIPKPLQDTWVLEFEKIIKSKNIFEIDEDIINEAFQNYIPEYLRGYFRNIPDIVKKKAK
ncbi:hypothetical protein LCGC14_0691870 [marine sediment metagenome]|uniref:Sulfatase N-terminal domain-containing protein n=1 Tax=marine sediment metagenome TaxID=412755 RepID=A0A0F9QQ31_9ZZZZ